MTKENIQEFAVALNSSPSEGAGEGSEAKRNKKTQLLSALLSASALGVFLEGCGGGDTSGGSTLGSESNPFSATDAADSFSGSGNDGWVSYAGSTSELGVNINLDNNPATVSGGWAAEDTLTDIDNLIGTPYADTLTGSDKINSFRGGRGEDVLTGGRGEDVLAGEEDTDTYVFNAGDGADRVIDDGGRIVFEQGTNNDYAGATYVFAYAKHSSDVRLIVTNSDNTYINTIDFTSYPDTYAFYTRSGGSDTKIPNTSLVLPPRRGSESNPFLATDATDSFTGSEIYDWVSYAGSNAGVNINLGDNPATVSGGWAAGDTLTNIDKLIGSMHGDTLSGGSSLEGGRGNDVLAGGTDTDTYVFNTGDGTDTITDSGSNKIVFRQGENNNDYVGATYTFAYVGGNVRLTVEKGVNTLNTIDFTSYPDAYAFYTRSGGTETEIPESSLDIPVRQGSEGNPFVTSDATDSFTGSGIYDWVSYADSNAGVTIDLSDNPATVSGGWAEGDTLTNIRNLIGSDYADTLTGNSFSNTFEGGRGNDVLAGESGTDTYVFNTGDGTDRITDNGGRIVFEQGTNNDYVGATYTFSNVERSSDVRLTVANGVNTLNTIDFTSYPDTYTFYTRSGGTDTEIPDASLVLLARRGSESNPFVATDATDSFTGAVDYDWVSYAGSNAGVTIDLSDFPATVSGGRAAGDRLNNIDNLIGSDHADTLSGDSSANTLRGGAGNDDIDGGRDNDIMAGGAGSDKYRFDAGDGTDTILSQDDGTGNKIVFRAPSGETYTNSNFDFDRGNWDAGFTASSSGDDLRIVVSIGTDTRNTVVIEDYFDQAGNAYTIYRTGYDSDLDGTIVSTQPAETS